MKHDDTSAIICNHLQSSAHVPLYRKRRTEMSHGTPLSPETHPRCSMLPYSNERKERKIKAVHGKYGNAMKCSSCSALGKEVCPTVTNSARGIPVLRDPSIEALQRNQQRNYEKLMSTVLAFATRLNHRNEAQEKC